MKKRNLRFAKGFRVVLGNRRAQATEMVRSHVPPASDRAGDELPPGKRGDGGG